MMCDTNWCTFCDNAISPYSDSLYCSEDCLRQDALMHHPMLGYNYADLEGFPHSKKMPTFVRRKPSIPTLIVNGNNNDITQSLKVPSLSPSLSSSVSSYYSTNPCDTTSNIDTFASNASYFHPKLRKRISSSIPFMEQLNQALLQS